MARRPTFSRGLKDTITKLDIKDARALSRLPGLETDDEAFGDIFRRNPGLALSAKGLEVSPEEITRIEQEIKALGRPQAGADNADVEVGVSVKVKF